MSTTERALDTQELEQLFPLAGLADNNSSR